MKDFFDVEIHEFASGLNILPDDVQKLIDDLKIGTFVRRYKMVPERIRFQKSEICMLCLAAATNPVTHAD